VSPDETRGDCSKKTIERLGILVGEEIRICVSVKERKS